MNEIYIIPVVFILLCISVVLIHVFYRKHKFLRLLDKYEEVTVLMHPNPDPDSMASAIAVSRMCSKVNTSCEIIYSGKIQHQENRAFEAVLDIEFISISEYADIDCPNIILVDHPRPRGFDSCESISPIAVIDHHPEDPSEADYIDKRNDLGSCSTILTEYASDMGILDDAQLATALAYGIISDTNNLTSGISKKDVKAMLHLTDNINLSKLQRISSPDIDKEVVEAKADAIKQREERGIYCVSDIGDLDNEDSIPQAADELINIESIKSVVVLGDYGDHIRMSGRSSDDRVHMGKSLRQVVQDIPSSSAGGHSRMGGGKIPCEYVRTDSVASVICRDRLIERIFESMKEGEVVVEESGIS